MTKNITDIPIFKRALESLKDKEIRDKVNSRLNLWLNYSCDWDMENWDGLYFTTYEYLELDDLPIADQLIFLTVILGNDANGEPLLPFFKMFPCVNCGEEFDNTYANSILYNQIANCKFNGADYEQMLENLANVDLPNEKSIKFRD